MLGDTEVSIENSVALHDGVLYFANSGGLVQGWDVSDVLAGGSNLERVFRYWTGDDTDATVVIDDAGDLYVASEYQRFEERSREVGQLMKLDPSRPDDPLVWSIDAREIGFEGAGGSWSTPALSGDLVYFTTAAGRVLAVERATGDVPLGATDRRPGHRVTGRRGRRADPGRLCRGPLGVGRLGAGSGSGPPLEGALQRLHRVDAGGVAGWIYFGTRQGYLYGLTERGSEGAPPS